MVVGSGRRGTGMKGVRSPCDNECDGQQNARSIGRREVFEGRKTLLCDHTWWRSLSKAEGVSGDANPQMECRHSHNTLEDDELGPSRYDLAHCRLNLLEITLYNQVFYICSSDHESLAFLKVDTAKLGLYDPTISHDANQDM